MAALLDGPEQRFSGIDAGDSDPALERGDRAQVVVARDQHRGGFCPRLGAEEHNLNRLTRELQIPITVPGLRVVQSGELRASQRGGEEECHQGGVTAFDRAVAQGVFSFARSGDAEIALSDRPLRNKRRLANGCSQAPRRHCQSALACARSTLFIKRKRPKPVPQPTTTPKILENSGTRRQRSSFSPKKGLAAATAKLMPAPTARELDQRAEEARAIAEQMRDPRTKRTMANLALSYERLAKHAAMRETREVTPKQNREQAA
jgi:hypothetical protein